MRLLNVDTLELTEFANDQVPQYAAASHRWISGGETTFKDVLKKRNGDSPGYRKLAAFAKYVKDYVPSIKWLWIDTCCINKDSAAELSEAINLMFEWYRNSYVCIAYLADVVGVNDLEHSDWFKRGWTLQELLAPRTLVLVNKTWDLIGFKGSRSSSMETGRNLDQDIQRITGIPMQALSDYNTSLGFSVDERLGWMDGRTTTREEDTSYALYGIFGVTPGANYGERKVGARTRLLTAIYQSREVAKTKNIDIKNPPGEPRRGSMHSHTIRYIRRSLRDVGAELGWTLVDEFDCPPDSVDANMRLFAGGVFMFERPDDSSTRLYLTIPSCEGDNRADWTIIAPNATFYPGKHRGHLIFPSEFPFKPPAVYWDTPLLSPFPRDGRFSGEIDETWSPSIHTFLGIFTTMASLVLQPPNEVNRSQSGRQFHLHRLPKRKPNGWHFDLPTGEGDWFRQCTQFFCRAFNAVDGDDEGVDQSDQSIKIADHHREMSCQAIESFNDHIMVDFLKLEPPFEVDGVAVRQYFAEVDTMTAWVEAEKRWARMLDEMSGWLISQDRDGGDRNAWYHM